MSLNIEDIKDIKFEHQCHCECHYNQHVMHFMPCCDQTYVQFGAPLSAKLDEEKPEKEE